MLNGRDSSVGVLSAEAIRLLLVDDNQLAVWALEQLAESAQSGMVVVGKTDNAGGALQAARQIRPDVVLVGLGLGNPALNLIPKLVKLRHVRVIALAHLADEQISDRAVLGGARGLLHREDSVATIIKAIRKVHGGELWLDRTTTGRIFGLLTQDDAPADPDSAKIASLTLRERNIIITLARAASARHRVIADLLGMSEHTLRNHLSKIYGKLELTGHLELYLYARRHGLDQGARA
jgi:DNA-binding NarL/FixJ family response regulator